MNENKEKSVPLYTKLGWAAAWLVMLLLLAMILRNCATAIIYGRTTAKAAVAYSHARGEKAGESGREPEPRARERENPVLGKAYNKGYRDGLDRYRLPVKP
jgi:hypothetical protein